MTDFKHREELKARLIGSKMNLKNVTLFQQGRTAVELSYTSFVEDIEKEYQAKPTEAIAVADAFTTQIAVFGYTRAKIDDVRVKIDQNEFRVSGIVANKLKNELKQGATAEAYNPKRLCAFRATEIRNYLRNADESVVPNLMRKLKLPDDYRELAFISSEYAAETELDAAKCLVISQLLDDSEIKKNKKIKQFERVTRFFKAARIKINNELFARELSKIIVPK
jgi:hypothetical protein